MSQKVFSLTIRSVVLLVATVILVSITGAEGLAQPPPTDPPGEEESPYEENENPDLHSPADPSSLPDLVVLDIWSTTNPMEAGNYENVSVKIRNQGPSATSTTFDVCLHLDRGLANTWTISSSIAAYAEKTINTTVKTDRTGDHRLLVIVDCNYQVPESDDENNSRLETWSWNADLVVEDIWTSTPPLEAGQLEFVYFRIKNNGPSPIIDTFYAELRIDDVPIATFPTNGLPAGAIAEKYISTWLPADGNHTLKVTVDHNEKIVESLEGNNTRSETWSWNPSQVDLVVEDIWSNTNPVQAGQTEDISFRVRNVGTSPTSHFKSRVWVGGDVVGTVQNFGIAAGGFNNQSVTVNVPLGGLHDIEVIVNYDSYLPESNMNNNDRTETWPWPPYLYFPTILR